MVRSPVCPMSAGINSDLEGTVNRIRSFTEVTICPVSQVESLKLQQLSPFCEIALTFEERTPQFGTFSGNFTNHPGKIRFDVFTLAGVVCNAAIVEQQDVQPQVCFLLHAVSKRLPRRSNLEKKKLFMT